MSNKTRDDLLKALRLEVVRPVSLPAALIEEITQALRTAVVGLPLAQVLPEVRRVTYDVFYRYGLAAYWKESLAEKLTARLISLPVKVAYVKSQRQSRDHECHWPGCPLQVPPARWGCVPHWRRLPKQLRDRIWATYRPGQERDYTPSREYVAVAREVQDWIAEHGQH